MTYDIEIQDLLDEGILSPDEVEEFEHLDPDVQDLVANGEMDMDDAVNLY
jgi:hypothetical protein